VRLNPQIRSQIIFLSQEGKSSQYIAKFLKIGIEVVLQTLWMVYNSENHIFLSKSMTDEGVYFLMSKLKEDVLIVDEDGFIVNEYSFSQETKMVLSQLYGFRIKLYG